MISRILYGLALVLFFGGTIGYLTNLMPLEWFAAVWFVVSILAVVTEK